MSTLYANWILGISNLVGLFVFPFLQDWRSYFILGGVIVVSLVYHLAESHKHGLSGVSHFSINTLSQKLLWIDTICAVVAFYWFVEPYMFYNSYFVCGWIIGIEFNKFFRNCF